MTLCPFCDAKVPYMVRKHVKDCEAILMGLLQEQVTPTVAEKPAGWTWSDMRRGA